ncbi:MAG: phosphodiesterase [Gammaproteobacteria bacterium]
MLLAQISDTHVQLPGGELDRHYDTAGHLARAVAHLNALDPAPDAVLLTGDTVDAGAPAEYARLRETLAPLRAPLFVIPGNHDEREAMRAAFGADGYLPAEGFLQYVVEDWPLRLIGLDTVVAGEPGGQLCEARLLWLDARLAEAPTRPTVLFLHHPPFRTGMTFMDGMGFREPKGLERVVATHPQVRHVLAGHLHRPIVTAFAGTLASTCPSTAHQVALDLPPHTGFSVVMEPPAVTLLFYDEQADTLVHHLSYVGARPRHVLHDGRQWRLHGTPPVGFRG